MAGRRKVVWSRRAQNERKKIVEFWIENNQSTTYSRKLERLFRKKLRLLGTNPYIGRKTDLGDNIRIKIIRDYHLFYQIDNKTITILTLWDTRQDPEDFRL